MKLTEEGLKDRGAWKAAGYRLPSYDRAAVAEETRTNPCWVHFGAGNIFRAFQANVVENLLNRGILGKGLIAAEGYDYEIIEKMNRPHDNYSILVTLKADGTVEKSVIGSIVESLTLDTRNTCDYERLKEIFSNPSLQMCTFTITEKGYSLHRGDGNLLPEVAADLEAGPAAPCSYIGKVTALLYTRYQAGGAPLALVSMDNCSHNGDKLRAAVRFFAEEWSKNGQTLEGFCGYIQDRTKISFPWTMIDKITPRPDASVEEILRQDGVEDTAPVRTSRQSYTAPFVNAEECEYLVIEDDFPNGRPPLEEGGFLFTDRETVNRVERMKVCTCLNPLHTALAVFGCLLGYRRISDEMSDPQLKKLAETIGYIEGLPVVTDPGVLDPRSFLDTVLQVRIPNPFMPDTPQRIATDTSQKLAIRYGETIKAYLASPILHVDDLKCIPLVFAGWLRYLTGVDDRGNPFELSPDPLLDALRPLVSQLTADTPDHLGELLRPLLKNDQIFGVDLEQAGLSQTVCQYLSELLSGPGSIRRTLEKYLG